MKNLITKHLRMLLPVAVLLLSAYSAMAQTSKIITIKQIFPRYSTYEHQMLKALNINPEGLITSYDEAPKPYAQLSPIQQAFGRLSLEAAEILALDLTPGYEANKLVNDISRIAEFKGRVKGILALLVIHEIRRNSLEASKDPNASSIAALKQWSTDLYRSMKITTSKAVLDEYQQWKINPCNYRADGYTMPANCGTPNYADLFTSIPPPSDILAKAGLKHVLGNDANNVALLTAMGMTGITATAAAVVLASIIGTPTGLSATGAVTAYFTLGEAFGYFAPGSTATINASLGAAGWVSVAAAPIAAAVLAIVVGTTEGFKVVEAQRVEPMLKMKLGAAMTDYINIANAMADINARDLFFIAFLAASNNGFKVTPPAVDGEVRFYCQAAYVSSFVISYTYNSDKTGLKPVYTMVEKRTKDLNLGSEESFTIPASAKNIRIQGWYLAGTWKELLNNTYSAPSYYCFTSYGTIFDAKVKNECPEVASITGKPRQLTLTHGGGYTAWFTLTYTRGGKTITEESKSFTIAKTNFYKIPFDAKDIHLVVRSATGLVWDPWKTFFDRTWPDPPNECIRIFGTSLDPKWNNECEL